MTISVLFDVESEDAIACCKVQFEFRNLKAEVLGGQKARQHLDSSLAPTCLENITYTTPPVTRCQAEKEDGTKRVWASNGMTSFYLIPMDWLINSKTQVWAAKVRHAATAPVVKHPKHWKISPSLPNTMHPPNSRQHFCPRTSRLLIMSRQPEIWISGESSIGIGMLLHQHPRPQLGHFRVPNTDPAPTSVRAKPSSQGQQSQDGKHDTTYHFATAV